MKTLQFHSDFASVTLCVNGVPMSVHGEIDITLKQPSKLPEPDRKVFAAASKGSVESISASAVPAAKSGD